MRDGRLVYFRILGAVEGISLLILLGGAMPYRVLTGEADAVRLMGSLHGALFLMYVVTLMTIATERKWGWQKAFLALLLSSVPFGSFWFDRVYLSAKAQTEGFTGPRGRKP